MTDRYNAFIVVLEQDIREDDAEPILNAIKHIRGVLSCKPHVADFSDAIATKIVGCAQRQKVRWADQRGKGRTVCAGRS